MKRKLDKNSGSLKYPLSVMEKDNWKERKDERRKINEKKEGERDSTEREREIERK